MKKENSKPENKVTLNSRLTFFNNNLSTLNSHRLQLNRSKNFAKYLAQPYTKIRTLNTLDTTLGIMSFSIYFIRFSSNLCLLVQLIFTECDERNKDKKYQALYFSLFNDCLWSMVNLSQFFWWSFQKSQRAGFLGMQLEVLAQAIDLLIMIVRYEQEREEYRLQYAQCSDFERTQLVIEWEYKELNFKRSLITATAILTVFGLFAFSIVSLPLSPVMSAIIVASSLLRLLYDMEKGGKLLQIMRLQAIKPEEITKKERALNRARLSDLNQIMLYGIFLPLALLCFMTLPSLALCLLGAVFICSCSSYLLLMDKDTSAEPVAARL